ncbi:head GIN domain-containing protein [Kordiimonas marina]|uniref:head GIN domain-containing protein n=1 Tax=Kordiimonas marina TaxID=2872312 RepID=UPI001FF56FB8|nr:head GIN domain-containing protein [Kordiimonas marina]MCJ9430500.1 DUF2807 domain-containing protein [Kordiimonas marina]
MKTIATRKMGVFAIGLTVVGLAAFHSVPTLAFGHDHGDKVHQTRDVAPFHNIRVKGGIELKLSVGKSQSVDVATEDDYQDKVKTYVEGDTLVIDMTDEDKHNIHLQDDEVTVTINMESLKGFEVLGAVDGTMDGFKGGDLSVDIRGAANLTIEGSCDKFDLDIKGAGKVDAEDMTCKDVDVAVKGVGSASVHASDSVDADVSGIGKITVYGHPKDVRKDTGGLGSIRIR